MDFSNAEVEWDKLRKEARQIENDIEKTLSLLSKLGANYGSRPSGSDTKSSDPDRVPLLKEDNEYRFETLSLEIESQLNKLSKVNNRMKSFCDQYPSPSLMLSHTLQRHQEILHEYNLEFKKMGTNIHAALQRNELLEHVNKSYTKSRTEGNKRSDLYLKEYDHIRSSSQMIDDQISIAIKTKEDLHHQKTSFKNIHSSLISLTNKFPGLNTLMQKINLKKKKDSIVLGTVIGVCMILLIVYTFH